MAKLSAEIVNLAFRRLALKAEDQALTADEMAYGEEVLEILFAELQSEQGLTIAWTLQTVPDAVAVPLANLLAVEVAPAYEIAPRDTRARAMGRVRAGLLVDDRDDRRDTDDDGAVTTAEAQAGQRAAYY